MNRPVAIILLYAIIWIVCAFQLSSQNVGKSRHWNKQRGYEPFRHLSSEGLSIDNETTQPSIDSYHIEKYLKDFTLRFTAVNLHNHPSKSYLVKDPSGIGHKISNPEWGFFIKGQRGDSLVIKVRTIELPDIVSSESAVVMTIRDDANRGDGETITVKDGIDCHTGKNICELSVNNGNLTFSIGNHDLRRIFSRQIHISPAMEFGFIAYPGANLKISDISFTDDDMMGDVEQTSWSNPDHLENYLSVSKDSMEGYWAVFDRTLEESLLRLGGDYSFALIKDKNLYRLIYLSGARVNGEKWKTGMVKALFTPDPFPGIFNVTWFDSEGKPLGNSIKAQTEDGEILTIQFPYHSSTLRLRKLPRNNP